MQKADTVFLVRGDGMCVATWGLVEAEFNAKARRDGREPVLVGLVVGEAAIGEHGPSHEVVQGERDGKPWAGCSRCSLTGATLTTVRCADTKGT